MFGAGSRLAGAGAGAGLCEAGGAAGRLIGRRDENRRVEQNRVFLDVTAARPRRLDEQRNERLGDRLARGNLDGVAAVTGRDDAELEIAEKLRAIDPAALEHVGTGQLDSQTL